MKKKDFQYPLAATAGMVGLFCLPSIRGNLVTVTEVRRVRAVDRRDLVDPACPTPSKRPGDRAITWLVVSFVFLAIIVLGFATARSRTSEPAVGSTPSQPAANSNQGFRVVRVLDGDTIVIVGQDNIELTLRLAGIDAPEKDQAFGNDAAQFVDSLLTGRIVRLDNVKRDKFGRVLAHAYLETRWIDLEIVQHGWAWVYPDSESRVLREAEASARDQNAGLWSSDTPTPPWEWRKGEN